MAKENRRVKMTKMLLNESFLSFLAAKPLTRITVKEICEDADVNRSTYYAYYTDPYDQLKKLEAEIMQDMSIFVDGLIATVGDNESNQYVLFKGLLDYIESKKRIFQILLSKSEGLEFEKIILSFFGERLYPKQGRGNAEASLESYQYIFAGTGCFGLIYHWLMNDNDMPTGALAELLTAFTAQFKS